MCSGASFKEGELSTERLRDSPNVTQLVVVVAVPGSYQSQAFGSPPAAGPGRQPELLQNHPHNRDVSFDKPCVEAGAWLQNTPSGQNED